VHPHPLESHGKKDMFSCAGAGIFGEATTHTTTRFRCTAGCDFDLCSACLASDFEIGSDGAPPQHIAAVGGEVAYPGYNNDPSTQLSYPASDPHADPNGYHAPDPSDYHAPPDPSDYHAPPDPSGYHAPDPNGNYIHDQSPHVPQVGHQSLTFTESPVVAQEQPMSVFADHSDMPTEQPPPAQQFPIHHEMPEFSGDESSDFHSDSDSDSDSQSSAPATRKAAPKVVQNLRDPRDDDVETHKAAYSTYAQVSQHGCCLCVNEGQEFLIATHSVEITDDVVFFHYEGDLGPLEAALAKIREGCCASLCGGGQFTASSATQSIAVRRSDIVIVKNANRNETLYEKPECCSCSCNCAWMVCYQRATVTLREEGSTTLMLVCRGTTAEQPLYVQAPEEDALRLIKAILADRAPRPQAQFMEH
jgi:hypothetical protein